MWANEETTQNECPHCMFNTCAANVMCVYNLLLIIILLYLNY
jgi:hypothetical protein